MAHRQTLVPTRILAPLRAACARLPEVVEEAAWVGTRWCVRRKNFAQVLMVTTGWPPAYARAAGVGAVDRPLCVLTFRSALPALDLYAFAKAPYFKPGWWPDLVGMRLDVATDWDEVTAHVTASYRLLAPQKLAARAGLPRCG